MCSIFGTNIENKDLIKRLGIAGESKGKDATGIATSHGGLLDVFKEPVRAEWFGWDIVKDGSDFYLGHTRFSTQGDPKQNENNHPFLSKDESFVLAHNGIIWNDWELNESWGLPQSSIKTDSYVIVQMLELVKFMYSKGRLTLEIIKEVCELLKGSFTLTIMDDRGQLFLLRHDNPLYYMFDGENLIYASTKYMLNSAVEKSGIKFNSMIGEIPENTIYQFDTIHKKFIGNETFKPKKYNYKKKYKNNDKVVDISTKRNQNNNLPIITGASGTKNRIGFKTEMKISS
ncbi:MAG: class II glutamine amidotransferase [bacterium]